MLEAILSPSNHMACSDGPMNMIPFLAKSSGSFGFSDAWPQPAQTAEKRTLVSFQKFLRIYFNKTPQTPIEIISRNIILIQFDVSTFDVVSFCDADNQIDVGVVVVVGTAFDLFQ
jgi:hypothetical protein